MISPDMLAQIVEFLWHVERKNWVLTWWKKLFLKKLSLMNETLRIRSSLNMGDSLVDQYPITLVNIVGFKIIKNWTNILQVLGG